MPQGPSLDTGQMKGVGNEEVAEGGSESLCSSRLSTPSLFAPVRDFGVRELPGASLSAPPPPHRLQAQHLQGEVTFSGCCHRWGLTQTFLSSSVRLLVLFHLK